MSQIDQEHLKAISPHLTQILEAELANGNEVVETRKHYPGQDSIFVALKHPFAKVYPISAAIEFREINDPHYWKAEYEDVELKHLLAC